LTGAGVAAGEAERPRADRFLGASHIYIYALPGEAARNRVTPRL